MRAMTLAGGRPSMPRFTCPSPGRMGKKGNLSMRTPKLSAEATGRMTMDC